MNATLIVYKCAIIYWYIDMKLTIAERNAITVGVFVGAIAGYVTGQWWYMGITIAVGYAIGHFWKK
jgi:hypothetical protein